MVPTIEPNLEDREALSYFLGVWLGDVSSNSVSITLQITPRDEEFGRSFHDSMEKLGLNPKMKCYEFKASGFRKRSASYLVVYGASTKLVRYLKSLSIDDIKTIAFENEENTVAFVRGFYESEGTNYTYELRRGGSRWVIAMTNTNRQIMELVEEGLSKIGFHFHLLEKNKPRLNPSWISHVLDLVSADMERNIKFLNRVKPVIKNGVPSWVLDRFEGERKQQEEIYKLLHEKYVVEKKSITDTAKSIGKGRKFVEYWLKKLEIPTRGKAYWNEMKGKALNLRGAGMTYKQVGEEFGISAPVVCKWSKEVMMGP